MTPRIGSFTSKQLIKILENNGFLCDHITGSHYVFYQPISKIRIVVPYHKKDLPRGTLMSIVKASGLDSGLFE